MRLKPRFRSFLFTILGGSALLIGLFFGCKPKPTQAPSTRSSIPLPMDAGTPPVPLPERTIRTLPAGDLLPLLDKAPMALPEEMRAVWVATVANIDWPIRGNRDFAANKQDFLRLLDYYAALHFNTVIVQVRTAGDAFYPSAEAPYSRFLTGKEGEGLRDQADPLAWMIAETHRRGMQFHAWINPYRATTTADISVLSPRHDLLQHPDWMIAYDKRYYYDPGNPEVQAKLLRVVRELCLHYPIDAIHIDDYFYPYKVGNQDFPDGETFKRFGRSGQNLGDWRRENINRFIGDIHRMLRADFPHIALGVSPFGVWRNKNKDPRGSATQAGPTAYDETYADIVHWIEQGWVDYVAPQLYWSLHYPIASHEVLLEWWHRYADRTHIYIGNAAYKIKNNGDKAWDKEDELLQQVAARKKYPLLKGNAFYNASSLMRQHPEIARRYLLRTFSRPRVFRHVVRDWQKRKF
ncbi:hypothetical protein A3SI_08136 [Nitritalea halalkaliphila LW7]|uniref:Glycosyl hydrolase-like 10 domain-containing protein n=1 Tax=Nitritalea halalkaliphila LW7 TaxID=1189621 RepID=I5C4Z7_9BACT|nr:family 10 glycosylhydrolase [Nitritalea halalkaliphila]EIM76899.1 hypothetical protein A3SI_08136 [Nitritalea halalkaliphila LW7]